MAFSIDKEMIMHSQMSFKEFSDQLHNQYYPEFYTVLNSMHDCIELLNGDYDLYLVESSLESVRREMDEMVQKEKLILFPYLTKLEQDHKYIESGTPFNSTRQHFNSIYRYLVVALETLLNIYFTDSNMPCLQRLQTLLNWWKDELKNIQDLKDDYYYPKFIGQVAYHD